MRCAFPLLLPRGLIGSPPSLFLPRQAFSPFRRWPPRRHKINAAGKRKAGTPYFSVQTGKVCKSSLLSLFFLREGKPRLFFLFLGRNSSGRGGPLFFLPFLFFQQYMYEFFSPFPPPSLAFRGERDCRGTSEFNGPLPLAIDGKKDKKTQTVFSIPLSFFFSH